nr:MAG TPA: hypothetical protein [Caudoviricetes sp.]
MSYQALGKDRDRHSGETVNIRRPGETGGRYHVQT